MGSAFEARWKEFFEHRPDKAVAIFAMFAGYGHHLAFMMYDYSRYADIPCVVTFLFAITWLSAVIQYCFPSTL
jgi:alcohol oxidase